jgi:hypothetical protein
MTDEFSVVRCQFSVELPSHAFNLVFVIPSEVEGSAVAAAFAFPSVIRSTY